ncbi:MAG: SUMF1/EgtB/PvdO family nonheme iron enzyme, partial [Lentisphaeria bacterium]|nr:SUMF1/EgtB/PvdO family nonheme iron enzyme [Lentisphaeria bacterium]
HSKNSSKTTHPVGRKWDNELGIHDMCGNVYEWCLDNWVDKSNKTKAEFTRPYHDNDNTPRVSRGGGWGSNTSGCNISRRYRWAPNIRFTDHGFRLALVAIQ